MKQETFVYTKRFKEEKARGKLISFILFGKGK
jgi:hypothetical protein